MQGSSFLLLLYVMFYWFPTCIASIPCSFLIYTKLTFDQKKKNTKSLKHLKSKRNRERPSVLHWNSYTVTSIKVQAAPPPAASPQFSTVLQQQVFSSTSPLSSSISGRQLHHLQAMHQRLQLFLVQQPPWYLLPQQPWWYNFQPLFSVY